MKNYDRNILDAFEEYNNSFKSILLTGPRQVGKTTFLKNIKGSERKYVSLDDFELRTEANNNPKEFIKKYSPPVIIDEIQYAPNLLSYIKMICDNSNEKGLFWLTGSQKIELMKNVSETLVGRLGVIEMNSFSYREKIKSEYIPLNFEEFTDKEYIDDEKFYKELIDGGMPGYLYDNYNKEIYFESYVKLYLERDIRELKQIEDLNSFHTFLISIASRAGQLLNYSSIAKEVKKDDKTIKSWISVLEATGIIKLIYPLRREEIKKAISMPKIIFMDLGLCTYLCKLSTKEDIEGYTNKGFIFENYVISEVIKINDNYKLRYEVLYYRDKNGKEIDLILEDRNSNIYPFEIKMSKKVDISMISNFKVLSNITKVKKGGIICCEKEIRKLTEKYYCLPISSIIG